MPTEQSTNQPLTTAENPAPENPAEPPQKISLVWVLFGIGGILLMWFISSKVF